MQRTLTRLAIGLIRAFTPMVQLWTQDGPGGAPRRPERRVPTDLAGALALHDGVPEGLIASIPARERGGRTRVRIPA